MKKALTAIGNAIITTLAWIVYAIVFRPIMLVIEVIAAVLRAVLDIVFFPLDFGRWREEKENGVIL